MAEFDLLVLGDVNPDVIVSGGDVVPAFGQAERLVDAVAVTVGGSGAIVACGAARLGLRVALAGVVGADPFGAFMREQLEARGVDTRGLLTDPERPTGATVVLSQPEDRAILTAPGAVANLRADRIAPRLLDAARHVHASSYFLQRALAPDLPSLFREVRGRGGTTSLDPNWDPSGAWNGSLRTLLAHVDVLLLNEAEASGLTSADDVGRAAHDLRADGAGCVAIKRGRLGAFAVDADGQAESVGFPVVTVDTTGAGDAFDAGFLTAYLAGEPLEACLALGNACGALSIRAVGGTDGQPTLDEARALIRDGKHT
jgi:sugar/nucleoside kinase (ribokinase family)